MRNRKQSYASARKDKTSGKQMMVVKDGHLYADSDKPMDPKAVFILGFFVGSMFGFFLTLYLTAIYR